MPVATRYRQNAALHKKRASDYYYQHIDERKLAARERNNTLNGRFSRYKDRAKQAGLEFNITIDYFKNFWQKDCHYCGNTLTTIGIDRKDNSKGYIEGNLVSCCFSCNRRKSAKGYNEFLTYLKNYAKQ